jgi:polar amino acid transport system substrate-binding protein
LTTLDPARRTGADLLCETLLAHGVDHCFANPGEPRSMLPSGCHVITASTAEEDGLAAAQELAGASAAESIAPKRVSQGIPQCPPLVRWLGFAPRCATLTPSQGLTMETNLRIRLGSVLGAIALCAAAPLAVAAEPIIAGTLTTTPPMLSYAADGTTLQGAFFDLAAAMSGKLGREITFKPLPFPALLPAMKSRQIAIVFAPMNDTVERQKVVDFIDFFNLGTKLLVKKGNPDHVEGVESLCGKTVATVQGSIQTKLISDTSAQCAAAGKGPIENLQYASPADARLQVQTGRATAFLGNSPVMAYLAATANGGTVFDVVRDKEYLQSPIGIAVAKDDTALRDALRKALDEIIADGSYRKILEKYAMESGAVEKAVVNGVH